MISTLQIVASGARTPLGLSAESSAAAVRARINRIVMHPFMADRESSNVSGALDGALDPGILGRPRLLALARSALHEVACKLLHRVPNSIAITVLLALPETRPGFDDSDASYVVDELRASTLQWERTVHVEGVGRGHAGGLYALSEAARRIQEGASGVFVVGGVDSYFDFDTIDWLQDHRQLLNEKARSGFAPGEAAGFVALAGDSLRSTLRLAPLGTLRGWGISREMKLLKSDDINLGEGLAEAVGRACAGLRLPGEAADTVYNDINGERYRIEEWGLALLRMTQVVCDTGSVSPAECWGDVGAASGPLLCNLAVQAWARNYARGDRALIWSGSEAGLRAAVVLEAPRR